MINFSIDGFNLQDSIAGIYVSESDFYSMPKIDLDYRTLAEQDGSVLLDKRIESKTITIKGSMIKETASELDTLIDKLKQQVNKEKVRLTIDFGDRLRIYQVTIQGLTINRRRGLSIATYTLTLFSQFPYGADSEYTTLLELDETENAGSYEIFTLGNYKSSPVTTITVNAVTSEPNSSISITNASNFIGITVSRDWNVGDVLIIDSFEKSVTVNGSEVEYSGRYPEWQPAQGNVNYVDTLTTRNVHIKMEYFNKYI